MKKLKFISLILAMVMLLSSCSFFNKEKEPDAEPPAEETPDITLSDYKLVYARSIEEYLLAKLPTFQATVKEKTGSALLTSRDREKAGENNDNKEILLGNTSRVESEEALKNLKNKSGYVVAKIDNKVVINGTSDYMVDLAWQYFEENFVNKATAGSGVIPFEKDFLYTNTEVQTQYFLGGSNAVQLSIVYNKDLDVDLDSDYHSDSAQDSVRHVDYMYRQALNFQTKLASMTGGTADDIALLAAEGKNKVAGGLELVLGQTDRAISTELLGELAINEYGILCKNGQIAFGGWTDDMVVNAINYLTQISDYCKEYSSGSIRLPVETVFKTNRTAYPDGVPQFTFGTLVGVVEGGSGTLERDVESSTFQECYSNCTEQNYTAYLTTLQNAGYTLYYENENKDTDSNKPNRYATYINSTNMVHVYYIGAMDMVRVIISRLDNINLPNVAKENYTKITEPKLTQMRFAYDTGNFGLCTILTLEDGSFIIYDGGGEGKNGKIANDHVRLYNLLKQLNTRSDGKIVIAAWILTHQHWDHYYNFYRFCENYGKTNVEIEQYICNLSSSSYKYNSYNPDGYGIASLIKVRDEFMSKPYKIVEVHTGQKVWVRNVEVEILFTQEDMYPSPIYYFNNTTLVTRLNVQRTNGNGTATSTTGILMLGDQNHEASHYMLDMYGQNVKASATLKSDIVQVAHHGVNGVISEVYNVADPTLLLWPTSYSNYNSWTNGKAGGNTVCHYEGCLGDDSVAGNDDSKHSYKIINKRLRDKINAGSLEVIVADGYNWTFTFPWAPGNTIGYTDDLGVTGNGTYTLRE